MEIDHLLIKNNKEEIKRKKALYFLAFVKFTAMIKIIKWHIFIWDKKPIDYGARMCEILFISSGFLIGYNYYQVYTPSTYDHSFKYAYKHFRNFYPLLIFVTSVDFYLFNRKIKNITDIEICLSEILMIKSWSRYSKLISSFNGISWFLSSLLFCYYLTPLLLNGIKNIKKSLIIFFLIAFLRVLIEEILFYGAINLFDANFHRGPIIRLLEFFMGMLLSPSYFTLKSYIEKYGPKKSIKILFTFVQFFSLLLIYYIMKKYNNILFRCHFVLIFNAFIFITGLDYGYLSDIFSHKFSKKIMSCQMEIYLIQHSINNIFNKIIKFQFPINKEFIFLIKLLIIFFFGYLYKILLKEKLAKILDMIILPLSKYYFD